jgi:hypothetical protein
MGFSLQCRSHNKIPKMLYIKIPDRDLLKAFEEEVFSLELMEPDGVDHEDGIVVNILEAGECDEHLPVIKMFSMYWPGYKNQCCTFIVSLACCWVAGTHICAIVVAHLWCLMAHLR